MITQVFSAQHVSVGQVKWRLEFRHVASPVARLLLLEGDGTAGLFALFGKVGRSPRVYASRDRDALLKQLQASAYKKMGLTLAGASHPHQPILHARPHLQLLNYRYILMLSETSCTTTWQSCYQ